jgi:hypothetical protein
MSLMVSFKYCGWPRLRGCSSSVLWRSLWPRREALGVLRLTFKRFREPLPRRHLIEP